MMLLRVVFFTIWISVPTLVIAENITGTMICKVMSNQIIAVEDGKPQTYSGTEGGFEEGDDLILRYSSRSEKETFYVELEDVKRADTILNAFIGVELVGTESAVISNSDKTFSFTSDAIKIPYYTGGEIRLFRYYKSDWMGLGVNYLSFWFDEPIVQTYTLDCRQTVDRIDDVMNSFKSD